MSNKDTFEFSSRTFIAQLLPLLCPLCEQDSADGELCSLCQSWLTPLRDPCPGCGEPDTLHALCGRCQKRTPPWHHARLGWPFSWASRYLIHRMKYQGDLACARSLASLWWQQQQPQVALDALIPVPMHASRLHKRGFNQAEWLARYWAKQSCLSVWTEAYKPQPTEALEGLNRSERRKVLRGAFALRERPPKRVAIVDDVLTTGTTSGELAKLLKRNGTQYIEVWTLARTPLE